MSRAFSAKNAVLKAYPDDKDEGVDLFLFIIEMDEEDFQYEFDKSPQEYIYGD